MKDNDKIANALERIADSFRKIAESLSWIAFSICMLGMMSMCSATMHH